MTDIALEALLKAAHRLAREAGTAILPFRRGQGDIALRAKADASPVTAADDAAERLILDGLKRLSPAIPVVSEEAVSRGEVPSLGAPDRRGRFWLVDPLDGTKEFIAGRDEFTINIALIEQGKPRLGVVHAPARDETYWGIVGEGAYGQTGAARPRPISARRAPADGIVALVSRSHRSPEGDAFLKTQPVKAEVSVGSALKFCIVARGKADLYPRFNRTMEWDTAAGHAVLEAAGGAVTTLDGQPLAYGKPGFANPGFIARGRRA